MAQTSLPAESLRRAIGALGSQSALSKLCGVSQPAVSGWNRKGEIPPEHVLKVEECTGISRHDLRPDIYGPAPALLDSSAKFEAAR